MAKRIRPLHQHLWAARDGRRAVLAALLLIFVAATSLTDGKLLPTFAPNQTASDVRAGSELNEDDNLRTGSILVTPADGNICEHRLIDNETWHVRPNGAIQCDEAVTWKAQRSGAYTPQSRLEAIRDGFVTKR